MLCQIVVSVMMENKAGKRDWREAMLAADVTEKLMWEQNENGGDKGAAEQTRARGESSR